MSDIKQELIEINKNIGKAELERDKCFLSKILSEDLQFRRISGKVVTKQIYLNDLESAENTYDYNHSEDIEVLLTGENTALVSLRVWAKGKKSNIPFDGIYRNTRVFIKQQGEWKCFLWFNTVEKQLGN